MGIERSADERPQRFQMPQRRRHVQKQIFHERGIGTSSATQRKRRPRECVCGQLQRGCFLRWEVIEQRAIGDACGAGNIATGRLVKAALTKQVVADLQDPFSRLRFGLGCDSHDIRSSN